MKKIVCFVFALITTVAFAQEQPKQGTPKWGSKFEQLDQMLPTPNSYRSSSGAPGVDYWQQKADYVINVELNDENQTITGSETITYFNNSPEELKYLWLQLDQNINADNSMTRKTSNNSIRDSIPAKFLATTTNAYDYKGGYMIKSVKDALGKSLPYIINFTMMRVDLPQPLKKGEKFVFSVDWSFNINDRAMISGRSGMQTDVVSSQAAAYATWELSPRAYVGGAASMGVNHVGLQRQSWVDSSALNLTGRGTSFSYAVQAEAGYRQPLGNWGAITPRVALRQSSFSIDRLNERGGQAALRLTNIGQSQLDMRIGLRFDARAKLGSGWQISPRAEVEYVRTLTGGEGEMTVQFAAGALTKPATPPDSPTASIRPAVTCPLPSSAIRSVTRSNIWAFCC